MGFKINYRSDRPITAAEAEVIQQAADAGCLGRTWLHCEPVHFYPLEADGFLIGGSKPNFQPDLDDAASAALEALPDGTSRDMLDVLCQISRDHEFNWLLSHDHDPNIGVHPQGRV